MPYYFYLPYALLALMCIFTGISAYKSGGPDPVPEKTGDLLDLESKGPREQKVFWGFLSELVREMCFDEANSLCSVVFEGSSSLALLNWETDEQRIGKN